MATINGTYNIYLVLLSFIIAIIASYTALDLAGRMQTAPGRVRWVWLLGGAVAMGTGIWSMHFVAMLAFQLPLPVAYDVITTLLSLVYAIIASGIALWLLSRSASGLLPFVGGGICMGAAIAWMHYTGMAAMRLVAHIEYSPPLVSLSVVIAVSASLAALWLAFRLKDQSAKGLLWQKLGSALVMGVAISGMHYTGMGATHFINQSSSAIVQSTNIKQSWLAVGIAVTTLFILIFTIVVSLFDKRFMDQTVRETTLQESEKRFRTLIREMQVGVLLLDADARILVQNQAAIHLLNLSAEGNGFFGEQSFIQSDGTPFETADLPVQRAIVRCEPIHDVVMGVHCSDQNQCRWLLVNADPQLAEDGQVERVVCTLSDISDRKRLEETLRQMAEREQTISRVIQRMRQSLKLETIFRSTTQELRDAIQCDRVVIYRFNPDWSGEFVAEAVGGGWRSLIQLHTDDTDLTRSTLSQDRCVVKTWDSPDLVQDTYLQETQGGVYSRGVSFLCVPDIYQANFDPCYVGLLETFQAKAYITVPITSGSKLWGLLACYQNSTARSWQDSEIRVVSEIGSHLGVAVQQAELFAKTRQQAEELKEAKELADSANRAKSEFLANMSHELRTPLNAILGFAQLMNRDSSIKPEHQQYLDIISRSGEHLLTLINDVLEMSKIEAGRVILNQNDFDLFHLLASLESMLKLKAHSKGLKLTFDRAADVPQFIHADESKLRQVLINLLGNAIKFTSTGHVTLRVRRAEAAQAGVETVTANPQFHILFQVEDTGAGIDPNELSHLFKAFKQTTIGLQSFEGTGLGLAISQKFVQLMGGNITVESTLGQGSVFTFQIQTNPATTKSAEAPPPPSRRIIGLAPNQPKYRILIAEDQPTNRLLLVRILEALGLEIQEARNGQEAIEIWQAWEPHLIWMDIRMPVVNGYEATKQIKASQKPRKTIIIALTASAFEEQRQEILASGCDDFVRKPFQREEVLEKMAKYLGLKYVYEEFSGNAEQQPATTKPVSDRLTVNALEVMPTEWTQRLYHAAAQGSDLLILQLIDEIPTNHDTLVRALTHLVENFQFDLIMNLSQSTKDP
jgi:PAS domain S-box-containing protein